MYSERVELDSIIDLKRGGQKTLQRLDHFRDFNRQRLRVGRSVEMGGLYGVARALLVRLYRLSLRALPCFGYSSIVCRSRAYLRRSGACCRRPALLSAPQCSSSCTLTRIGFPDRLRMCPDKRPHDPRSASHVPPSTGSSCLAY